MEFTAVCPRRNPGNPDLFSLCEHMPSCSAYAGASCACSISSRSAKPQQTCFGKQPVFHAAGEGCAGRAWVEASVAALTKPPDRIVINQGLGSPPPPPTKGAFQTRRSHRGLAVVLGSADGTCSESRASPQGSKTIPVHAACCRFVRLIRAALLLVKGLSFHLINYSFSGLCPSIKCPGKLRVRSEGKTWWDQR